MPLLKSLNAYVSSLASLGSIDGNTLAVGTLLGSLSTVSIIDTKNGMSIGVLRSIDAGDFLPNLRNNQPKCI